MHPTFVAKLKPKKLLDGVFGSEPKVAGAQPGTIPAHVNPPKNIDLSDAVTTASVAPGDTGAGYAQETSAPVTRVAASSESVATAPSTGAAKTQPNALQRMGQFFGLKSADASAAAKASPPPPAAPKPAVAVAAPAPKPVVTESKQKPAPQPRQVAQAPAAEPAPQPAQTAAPAPAVMSGAVAPLPTSSFDSRFGTTR
jgi:hypothetical protein